MQSIAVLMPLVPGSDIVEHPCDGIMIYSFATQQAPSIFQEISRARTESVFIAGGPHPSARPEETLQFFDYVVVGEGEETLPDLIDVIRNEGDILSVKGIACEVNSADVKSSLAGQPRLGLTHSVPTMSRSHLGSALDDSKQRTIDINNARGTIHPPDNIVFTEKRNQVNLDRYPPFDLKIMRNSIEITRGCPFSCAYCANPQLFGHAMRHRSIDMISKYAKFLRDIRFTSPNAFAYGSDGKRPRIEKIESLLHALSSGRIFFGTFPSEVRPEFITDSVLELVSDYCENTAINMGGQSGSQRILEIIRRKHTVEDIIIGAEKCIDHGFTPIVDFIFGLPDETEFDQLETLKLIKWLTGIGGNVHSHYFMPLPGTEFENKKPAPLSGQVKKVMGELALHRKSTGVWAKV